MRKRAPVVLMGLRAGASLTRFAGCRTEFPARPIRQLWEAPVFTERRSIGLDVHARSVAAAAIDSVTGELFQTKLTPSMNTSGPGPETCPVRWR